MFVDLLSQPRPDPLRLRRRARTSRHHLVEVVPLARHRVEAGVDLHPQRDPLGDVSIDLATVRRGS
jgi:hypothetical protein